MTDIITADTARKRSRAKEPNITAEKTVLQSAIDAANDAEPAEFSISFDATGITAPKRKAIIRYLRGLDYDVINNAGTLDISWE